MLTKENLKGVWVSVTMPWDSAVRKIIAQAPMLIAPSMMNVRRWLRHRLRQASCIEMPIMWPLILLSWPRRGAAHSGVAPGISLRPA